MTIKEIKARFEKKVFITVDYNDIDRLINTCFGTGYQEGREWHGYECVPEMEWNNDSSHEVRVSPERSDYDLKYGMTDEKAEAIKKAGEFPRKETHSVDDLLNYLCFKGVIEPGTYLIEVYW